MLPSMNILLATMLLVLDPSALVVERVAHTQVAVDASSFSSLSSSVSVSLSSSSAPSSVISSLSPSSRVFMADTTDNNSNLPFRSDTVIRVTDANTVQLDKAGLVKLWGVETPTRSTDSMPFSECLDKSPSYKIRQLLPKGTKVQVHIFASTTSGNGSSTTSTNVAVIIRAKDGLWVSQELVRSGFARVRIKSALPTTITTPSQLVHSATTTVSLVELQQLEQQQAKEQHKGLFRQCSSSSTSSTSPSDEDESSSSFTEAIFEPLEWATETQWGDDGGKTVRRKRDEPAPIPSNPGDKVGCSDFETYEAALQYYETYFPYYGDVAKLDRRQMGVPCPGLPHTKDMERYRMKIPKKGVERISMSANSGPASNTPVSSSRK